MIKTYDRQKAVNYAIKWALSHNPVYYHFGGIGGDCTNYISQCIYAGSGVMNYSPLGWFYNSLNSRSPSWTSVISLQNFLLNNKGIGPFGQIVNANQLEIGDIVQLKQKNRYNHTLIVSEIRNNEIYICAHSSNELHRPLKSYPYKEIKYIKILGVRINPI